MILSPSKIGSPKIIKQEFNEEYNEGTVLVEVPACRRTIFYEHTPYFLSFPKILFFMRYIKTRNENFHVRFARMAFTKGRKKELFVPPLTNLGGYNLEICLSIKCQGASLQAMIENQIANIFASPFNLDITDVFEEYYEFEYDDYDDGGWEDGVVKYFEKWQKKTKKNPNWVPKKFKEYKDDQFYDWYSNND